jgi:hypothetical protein
MIKSPNSKRFGHWKWGFGNGLGFDAWDLGFPRRGEAGYALIAALGALTVMLIFLTGLLPTVAQEVKRERETEMLFRGRQIVMALAQYHQLCARFPAACQGSAVRWVNGVFYPRSLPALTEGINLRTTSKVRLLRPVALKDPMNGNNPWKGVGFGDPALQQYLEAYFDYSGQAMPPQFRAQYLGATVDLDSDETAASVRNRARVAAALERLSSQIGDSESPGFIFGVVSDSDESPIRDYYGLERYNQWVFAYIPVPPVPGTNDEQIQMLTREIMFPSDPLALIQFGIKGAVVTTGVPPPVNPGKGRGSGSGPPQG